MGTSFRPVREEWGTHTDCFIDPEHLVALLEGIAYDAEINRETNDYGQQTAVLWIENGAKFLTALESSEALTVENVRKQLEDMLCLDAQDQPDDDDINALIENVKSLAPSWHRSIGSDGELRFYIDRF